MEGESPGSLDEDSAMQIRFGVGPAGIIKKVAGQSVQTRVFKVMVLPILPLGVCSSSRTSRVTNRAASKVPLFSKVGVTSVFAAYLRAYLFLLWVIPWWSSCAAVAAGEQPASPP